MCILNVYTHINPFQPAVSYKVSAALYSCQTFLITQSYATNAILKCRKQKL